MTTTATDLPSWESTPTTNTPKLTVNFDTNTNNDLPIVAAATSIPHKRPLDDTAPAVSSPLNPDGAAKAARSQKEESPSAAAAAAMAREKPPRTKKDSLKKRESKAAAAAAAAAAVANNTADLAAGSSSDDKDGRKEPGPSEAGPLRYKLAPPRAVDFEPAKGPLLTHHQDIVGPQGENISFYETAEHVYNKKNFTYTSCIADPHFPSSLYYRHTEPEPHGPHISFEDRASHMFLDESATHITTDKGFRMARANVSVREGRWYWECRVTRGVVPAKPTSTSHHNHNHNSNTSSANKKAPESHGHVRIGFARREASVDAPVGFDAYSYGFRDVHGEKVHMSRPKSFFPEGEAICEGDVIGMEIQLPAETLHRKVVTGTYNPAVDFPPIVNGSDKNETTTANGGDGHGNGDLTTPAANVVRDRVPIRFRGHIYFEQIAYHSTKELEDLMNPSPVVSASVGKADTTSATGRTRGGGSASDPPNPNHPIPALRTLPGSSIRVYKNGKLMGTPFEELLSFLPPSSKPLQQPGAREGFDDGNVGYYPAVSCFRGGAVQVNFGPTWWCPPEGIVTGTVHAMMGQGGDDGSDDVDMIDARSVSASKRGGAGTTARTLTRAQRMKIVRPVSERYEEHIAEDVFWDLVDEVDSWARDGGIDSVNGEVEGRGMVEGGEGGGGVGGGKEGGIGGGDMGEIKELVQDD